MPGSVPSGAPRRIPQLRQYLVQGFLYHVPLMKTASHRGHRQSAVAPDSVFWKASKHPEDGDGVPSRPWPI
jgi:hypothetical protein